MSRNRMIKSEFWKDPKVGEMSITTRLLFIGMWNFADDSGVVRGDPIYLRSEVFTYDDISKKQINAYIDELVELEVIVPIKNNGEIFFLIKNFLDHQVINRPSNFRYVKREDDDYNELIEDSLNNHGAVTERSLPKEKGKGKVNGKDKVKEKDTCESILTYLNEKADKKFKFTDTHFKFIRARIKDGFDIDQFKKAINNKVSEWKGTKMDVYLRPETLFGNKMDGYINQGEIIDNKFVGNDDDFRPPEHMRGK